MHFCLRIIQCLKVGTYLSNKSLTYLLKLWQKLTMNEAAALTQKAFKLSLVPLEQENLGHGLTFRKYSPVLLTGPRKPFKLPTHQ